MEIETGKPAPLTYSSEKNLPWIEKYRPESLSDLVSHTATVGTLLSFIKEDRLPNMLFYGPPGTGKTSTIMACAKEMYKSQYRMMVLELNASDDRGINIVRENIKSFAENRMFFSSEKSIKLVILDEADSMTNPAQMALRRIMEKYSKTTRFCLICNYVNKVIPALVSRCTRFKFKQIPTADSSRRIKQICTAEGLPLDDGAITAVIAQAEGDMRRAVNLLQSIRLSLNVNKTPGTITEDYVYTLTGTLSPAQMTEILRTLLTKPVSEAYSFISRIQEEQGVGLATIIKDLLPLIVDYSSPVGWKPFLITRLAEIEFRLSHNCSEKIQLGSLVGAFFEVRTLKITSEPIRA